MSNIDFLFEERATKIGNFMVGRLLPFRQKRTVGPFIFIDHMGPAIMKADENLDIGPHPHIGLSTLTFLLEGTILHKDSLGSNIEINPGAVNWMTAGKGVVHSERTPSRLRKTEKSVHGLQIWIAMPKEFENIEPSFTHIPATEIPTWKDDEVEYRLIAGEYGSHKSPVPVYSKLFFLEIKSKTHKKLNIGQNLFGESALYILQGGIKNSGITYEPKQVLITTEAQLCEFDILPDTVLYIMGGEPFPEERYIDWNFVSSDLQVITLAKENWINQKFPKMEGEDDRVPYPSIKK